MAKDGGLGKIAAIAKEHAVSSVQHVTELVRALGFAGPAVLMCTVVMTVLVRSEHRDVVDRVWPDIWWAWKWLCSLAL